MNWRLLSLIACVMLGVVSASEAQLGPVPPSAPASWIDAGVADAAYAPAAPLADASDDAGFAAFDPANPALLIGEEEPALVVGGDADDAPLSAASDETMVVTGTRIRRPTSFSPAAAVDVVDRAQLERSGATNLADVVASITSAQGSGFQGGGNSSTVSAGTVAVNMRGLGTGATLILINGRRLNPSGAGTDQVFGDLSVMPLAAVERIEVLKGGGSAVYGADAVGGVLNIITRPRWEGVRGEVNGQTTTRWDQQDVTASGGVGIHSERGSALLSLSYFRRSELNADKRAFTRGQTISQQGQPGTYIVPGLDPTNPRHLRYPDPGCAKAEGSAVTNVIINGAPTADQVCTFDFRDYWPLLGNLERANLFGSADFDFTRHTTLFGEVLASRMRTDGVSSPSYAVPPPLPVVPADHVDNPFGRRAQLFGRPLGAASGPARNTAGDDTLRIVTGLKGDFEGVAPNSKLESFSWEIFGSWGVSRYSQQIQDNLREPLQSALNSCNNPNDLSRCFNPFYSAIDGSGTPNSQEVIDSFVGTYTFITEHVLHTYNAGLNGLLFKLPGGDLGFAAGAELRREWRSTQADHDAEQERYGFLIGNKDSKASRNIYSGYLELLWPFYRGVELQTAVRLEHYDDIDRTTPSPFAGLTLTPADILGRAHASKALQRLSLRGSITSAFRAPTVYQSAPNFAIVPTLLTLSSPPSSLFVPVQSFGNPNLKPERALVASAGLSFQPVDELMLSGEFWHYEYRDRIVTQNAQQALANDESLAASGQRDPRVLRDALGNLERIQVRQINIDGSIVTRGFDFGALITITGATFGGSREAGGALSLGAQGTYTMNFEFPRSEAGARTVPNTSPPQSLPPPHCKGDRCDAAGSRNVKNFAPPLPRWRVNFPLTYSIGGHGAAVIAHYISPLEDDNNVGPNGQLGKVDAWVTTDVQYGYTFKGTSGRELALRIGLYNVFDKAPPRAVENAGFESLVYDPRGRMVYGKLMGSF